MTEDPLCILKGSLPVLFLAAKSLVKPTAEASDPEEGTALLDVTCGNRQESALLTTSCIVVRSSAIY